MSSFRTSIIDSKAAAFGCSHVWGIGVDSNQTWSHLLGAMNFGVPGVSADFVARIFPAIHREYKFDTAFVLWPDWTRFEYRTGQTWKQSLPTDSDRIYFMDTHNEPWLKQNFQNQVKTVREYCKKNQIYLIDMTLYDLIPYIDNADKWPVSSLGHHYSEIWHSWVADIFNQAKQQNLMFPLSND